MVIVFGGSFNPPTIAHLNIIKKLLSTFESSQVLVLPVGDDYKKPELVPIHHRINMLHLLVHHLDKVVISDLEANHTYQGTLASLKKLKHLYSDIHLTIGSDHLTGLKSWINYKELLATYPLIVMTRNDTVDQIEAEQMFADVDHHFTFIKFNEDISSSRVRQHLDKNNHFLTPEVYHYIKKNHIY